MLVTTGELSLKLGLCKYTGEIMKYKNDDPKPHGQGKMFCKLTGESFDGQWKFGSFRRGEWKGGPGFFGMGDEYTRYVGDFAKE